MREVASYRSYINVVQTVGRSSGGAIGGILADTIGWRKCVKSSWGTANYVFSC